MTDDADAAPGDSSVPDAGRPQHGRTAPPSSTDPVGVGPWPGGPSAWPRLPDGDLDPRFDADLLADGDRRNVVDRYRYWTVDAIVADLDGRRHPLHVAIENWGHDLNIGSVVRTANAFNVAGVHVVGRRRWNRRGAMVTDRYLHVHHHPDAAALAAWATRGTGAALPATVAPPSLAPGTATPPSVTPIPATPGPAPNMPSARPASGRAIPIVGVDNVPGSIPIEGYAFPRECVLLFGQESSGLTPEAQAVCVDIVHITQYGSTRSMNAGAAAAIAMYAWAAQHAPSR